MGPPRGWSSGWTGFLQGGGCGAGRYCTPAHRRSPEGKEGVNSTSITCPPCARQGVGAPGLLEVERTQALGSEPTSLTRGRACTGTPLCTSFHRKTVTLPWGSGPAPCHQQAAPCDQRPWVWAPISSCCPPPQDTYTISFSRECQGPKKTPRKRLESSRNFNSLPQRLPPNSPSFF